jgi:hypothetical protein
MAKGLPRSLANAKAGTEQTPRRVRYTAKNLALTITGGASTAVGAGTVVLGGLPQGNILLLGGVGYLQFSSAAAAVATDWEGDFAIGTTADANSTLAAGDVDIIASTEIGAATSKVSPLIRCTRTTAAVIDNTANDLELNLNVLTDDNDVTDVTAAAFLVNGYLDLVYIVLGDD